MAGKRLITTLQNDIAIVAFQDARILDERNVQAIARELNHLVDKEYRIKMILDLNNVQYLSSAVVGKIVALYKKILAENGELKICHVRKDIMDIFKITNLHKVIDIQPTLTHALNAFKTWRPKKKKRTDSGKKSGGLWGMFKKK